MTTIIMTQIETAKNIIANKGICVYEECDDCPARRLLINSDHNTLFGVSNKCSDKAYNKAKHKWFKNWLKENDK